MAEQMTTLKEIEARVKKTWKAAELGSANNVFVAPVDLEETLLLVRAVRQLGAIVRERESASITATRIKHGSLDPDVLALLEDADA